MAASTGHPIGDAVLPAALQLVGAAPLCVADAWPRTWRHRYVRELHARGLTDVQVAERTAMSTYTSARIRRSLGLAPNEGR